MEGGGEMGEGRSIIRHVTRMFVWFCGIKIIRALLNYKGSLKGRLHT